MPRSTHHLLRRGRQSFFLPSFGRASFATLLALLLSACAPDAWRPDKPYDVFLDRVQKECGEQRIGNRSIGWDLLQTSNPNAYFLDLTSRFYHGEISETSYADALAGSFGGASAAPGILCILAVPRR
jgi:hypothetical protein